MSKYRPTRRHACARTVCVPRLKLYETSTSKKKLETSVDLNGRAADGAGNFGQAVGDGARNIVKALRAGAIFAEGRHGFAGVAANADARIDFNFAENGHAIGNRGFRAFAVAEDVHRLAAVRAREGAHVLDHAEHLHVHLAKHFDGLAHVVERDGRRRSDHDGAGDRNGLDQGQLHVAGARWKINDQIIQFAPFHAAQELRDHAVEHRPAPNHRFVAGIQQAHGDHLQTLRLHGDDVLVVRGLRFLRGAEHDRDVGAIHVGVEQTDFMAELHERQRQIYSDRRLADAAFAAGDGDEVFHAGNRLAFGHLLWCWTWGHTFTLSPSRNRREIPRLRGPTLSGRAGIFDRRSEAEEKIGPLRSE